MKKQELTKLIGVIILIFNVSTIFLFAQHNSYGGEKVGKTVKVKNKSIDWEAFDNTSSVAITEIKVYDLQGLWKAYKGLYKFGEFVNEMKLTQPFIIEVKNDTYRRHDGGTFGQFTLKGNLIIKLDGSIIDTGIINKITSTELTISWKDKANYTRYYYKKLL